VITKAHKDSADKVDLAAAAVLAFDQAQVEPAPQRPTSSSSADEQPAADGGPTPPYRVRPSSSSSAITHLAQ
jgi:hypothetical protein